MVEIVKEQVSEPGCLVVGSGVSVTGIFSVPGRAIINGSVEGELSAKEVLVGSSGCITGKVDAELVDIRGEIHEILNASRALVLRASGRATGSISYAEIAIEKGARLRGTLSMLSGASPTAADPSQAVEPVRAASLA